MYVPSIVTSASMYSFSPSSWNASAMRWKSSSSYSTWIVCATDRSYRSTVPAMFSVIASPSLSEALVTMGVTRASPKKTSSTARPAIRTVRGRQFCRSRTGTRRRSAVAITGPSGRTR